MNEPVNVAAQCMFEIDVILKKYNCELCTQELRRNGESVSSSFFCRGYFLDLNQHTGMVAYQIMVIQKPSLIKPLNGEKVIRMP